MPFLSRDPSTAHNTSTQQEHPLLPLFQRELKYLQKEGQALAKQHPEIADMVFLDSAEVDPDVKTLIESVAFLNAYTHQQLDQAHTKIHHALLNTLYPEYLNPVPVMTMMQFTLASTADKPVTIPVGFVVDTNPTQGETCRFQTVYENTLWPIQVSDVLYHANRHGSHQGKTAQSMISIKLSSLKKEAALSTFSMNSLRFYLKDKSPLMFALLRILMTETVMIELQLGDVKCKLDHTALQAVGLKENEAMLPQSSRHFSGYNLLREYFLFPEKFLAIELSLATLWQQMLTADAKKSNTLSINIYLQETHPALNALTQENFALGCVPAVNLFSKTLEPVLLHEQQAEYALQVDARRPDKYGIHSLQTVSVIPQNRQEAAVHYQPLYGFTHQHDAATSGFWSLQRQRQQNLITLVAPTHRSHFNHTLSVTALCTNGDQLHKHFATKTLPKLQSGGASFDGTITWATYPTRFYQPEENSPFEQELITYLGQQYHSLLDNEGHALKELLRVSNRPTSPLGKLIKALSKIDTVTQTRRLPGKSFYHLCQGLEVRLYWRTEALTTIASDQLFLLNHLLAEFFHRLTPINQFTQLVVYSEENNKELYRWPAKIGNQVLR